MNFYNPLRDSVLLIILILFTVGAYFIMIYLRGKKGIYFGNLQTLEKTHGFKIQHVNSIVLIVKLIVVVLLYMMATNAIEIKEFRPVSDTDYVLLLDVSSSMAKTDFYPNRLDAAKNIAMKWLNILPNNTAVGLNAFSQDSVLTLPLSFDKGAVKTAISNISIDYARSGTDLDYALNTGIDMLNESSHKKSILLFTDGTESVSDKTIAKFKDSNINLIIFGIGSDTTINLSDIPDEFKDDYSSLALNMTLLESIANATNGKAYQVSNELELQSSFNDATLEQIKVSINSAYYVTLLIALISILELIIYARFGAL